MTQYAISFLMTSIVMSVVILAVLIFNALFPKVLTAKLRYAVWLIILIGLIFPLRPAIGSGLVEIPLPKTAQIQSGSSEDLQTIHSSPETDSNETDFNKTESNEIDSKQGIADAGAVEGISSGRSISAITICGIIWGFITVMIFSCHIWRYIRFFRMIRRWGIPVQDEKVLSVLRSVQAETIPGSREIGLKVCEFTSSSMLTGFFHPVILLPKKHFDEEELGFIFKHELIHYKRHDLFVKFLSLIAISIHWFNPVVYWMCTAIQADGEASCDEAVLKDTDMEGRKFYAEVIIGMIGNKNTAGTILSTCFYGGKASIKRRLDSIMNTTFKIKKPAFILLAVIAVLTFFSGSVFAFTQKPAPINTPAPAPIDIPDPAATDPISADQQEASTEITAEQAKEIALEKTGGGTVIECKVDYEDHRKVYEIKIVYDDIEHEIDVDVINGTITDYSAERVKDSSVKIRNYDNDDDD